MGLGSSLRARSVIVRLNQCSEAGPTRRLAGQLKSRTPPQFAGLPDAGRVQGTMDTTELTTTLTGTGSIAGVPAQRSRAILKLPEDAQPLDQGIARRLGEDCHVQGALRPALLYRASFSP